MVWHDILFEIDKQIKIKGHVWLCKASVKNKICHVWSRMLTDKITKKGRGYLSTKYEKLYFNFTKKTRRNGNKIFNDKYNFVENSKF